MKAIHINHTLPFMQRTGAAEYAPEDFELLTTILSALKWREHNGEIEMLTDKIGYEYYRSHGLLPIWDNVKITFSDMNGINTRMFWAAGKLFALAEQTAPVAVMDTDFIVWAPIAFDFLPDAACIHFEPLYPDVYPGADYFKTKNNYHLSKNWDWTLDAANTAFCVIKNNELLKSYTSAAIEFMRNSEDCDDTLKYMVFAEQRLLPMCAAAMDCEIRAFSDLRRLFEDGEKYFTHVWGMKQQMRDNPTLRTAFCIRCADRIRRDFPEYSQMLHKNNIPYF